MRIIEIFHSFQGEGPETGLRTVFVRLARCNLRCTWCDTTYSFEEGTEIPLSEVLAKVESYQAKNVSLTGGEPLLQKEGLELTRILSEKGYRILIETGGSLDIAPYTRLPGVLVSMDVKCPGSGMEKTLRTENLQHLRPVDVVKFVIQDRKDYEFARKFLEDHPFPAQKVFQPVWGVPSAPLAEWLLEDRLDARLMLQEHKYVWGDARGH
ncbi:MAG: radical SAM protein [Candidatus Thermoplasmatota archaeon]|jgi:7-carboxy-7-deazaguanine synthase|nr:radical SAM protein [Candidatus Thermoplasmatota archaeon]